MTFHDVEYVDDEPQPIPRRIVERADRESPGFGEEPVFAVEYRKIVGQRRRKGNRYHPAERDAARGIEILYVTAGGRAGCSQRYWGDAVVRWFRASMGVDPDDLGAIEPPKRWQVRDALQVLHYDALPDRSRFRPEARPPGFRSASAIAADGGAGSVPMVESEGPAGRVVLGPEPGAYRAWEERDHR